MMLTGIGFMQHTGIASMLHTDIDSKTHTDRRVMLNMGTRAAPL